MVGASGMVEAGKVSEHVQVLAGQDGGRYPHGNPLLITGDERRALVDSALGVPPPAADLVLLSHYHEDHVVGLAADPETSDNAASRGARHGGEHREIWIHHRDLDGVTSAEGFARASGFTGEDWLRRLREEFAYAPLPDAKAFDDDTVFDLGGVRVEVVPLPGHTAGHCGFYIRPDNVFFLGDVDLSRFGPFYGDATGSLRETAATIETCTSIQADLYLTYHHKGPYADRTAFLDDLEQYRDALRRRRDAVLALLDQPRSPAEMVGHGVVYRPGTVPEYGADAEARMCELHLRELLEEGLVVGPDGDGRYRRSEG